MQPLDTLSSGSNQKSLVTSPAQGNSQSIEQLSSPRTKVDVLRLLRKRVRKEAKKGNYSAAIRILSYLIRCYPRQAEYYSNRGLMYQYCHQWARAMSDYNQALKLQPNADSIYNNRANCHAAQGNWIAAVADYDQAIDINPFNMQARINQGITLREASQYEEAIACFDIALFFDPFMATTYAERGRTYHLQGHWNCAMGDYQRALNALSIDTAFPIQGPKSLTERIYRWRTALLLIHQ